MHSESLTVIQHSLFTFLLIFGTGLLGGWTAEKLRIPDVAVYLLLGIAIGPAALGWIAVPADSLMNQGILLVGACLILFHGGIVTGFPVLAQVWRTVTLLSTAGVMITALVVAVGARLIFGLAPLPSLLLGAIWASTDPAALVPIFQRFPIRRKVAETVITESAFTDATGAILTTVVASILLDGGKHTGTFAALWEFVRLAGGGLLIGGLIGAGMAFLISENDRGLLKHYTPTVSIFAILAAYVAAEALHASGFMSVFTTGLIVGNARYFRLTINKQEEQAALSFLDAVTLKARMLIFILLGSQVDFHALRHYGLTGLLLTAVFILIARPLTVLACLLPDRKAQWSRREMLFFCWTRETGVIAAALVGILAGSGFIHKELFAAVTFVVILVTLVVQAGTTPFLAKALGLLAPDSKANITEAAAPERRS